MCCIFFKSQQHLDRLCRCTVWNLMCMLDAWSLVLSFLRSKKIWIMFFFLICLILFVNVTVLPQRSEIPWTRILEVWWGWKQVLSSCYRTIICHFTRFGNLYISKSVSFVLVAYKLRYYWNWYFTYKQFIIILSTLYGVLYSLLLMSKAVIINGMIFLTNLTHYI